MLDYDYFLNSNSLMKPPFIMLYLTPQIMNPYHNSRRHSNIIWKFTK